MGVNKRSIAWLATIAGAVLIGVAVLGIRASGLLVAVQPESGHVQSPATVKSDATASGGSAVQFGNATNITPISSSTPFVNCTNEYGLKAPASVDLGSTCWNIVVGGSTHIYNLYQPAGSSAASKLVIVLHPSSASGPFYQYLINGGNNPPTVTTLDSINGFNAMATANNYVVAYLFGVHPNSLKSDGTTGTPSWDFGYTTAIPHYVNQNTTQDLDYIDAVIQDLALAQHVADANKVYIIGSSAGALMTHRQACEGHMSVRAFISVSGNLKAACTPFDSSRQFSFLEIHGDADANVPYLGGTFNGQFDPTVPTTMANWATRKNCSVKSTQNTTFLTKSVVWDTWKSPSGQCSTTSTDFVTILAGGHSWGQGLSNAMITPFIVNYINSH